MTDTFVNKVILDTRYRPRSGAVPDEIVCMYAALYCQILAAPW